MNMDNKDTKGSWRWEDADRERGRAARIAGEHKNQPVISTTRIKDREGASG